MSRQHARISASGIKRRMNCLGSLGLEKFRPSSSSAYAAEGTVAHSIMEAMLAVHFHSNPGIWTTTREFPPIPNVGDKVNVDGHEIEVTSVMLGFAKQACDEVIKVFTLASLIASDARIMIETEVTSRIFPDLLGGHADIVIDSSAETVVFDLKYGAGVLVDDPTQLAVYGLLAMGDDEDRKIKPMRMVVFQPRMRDEPIEWSWSRDEVRQFRDTLHDLIPVMAWLDKVMQVEEDAFRHQSMFTPGDHCQFCTATAICPAQKNLIASIPLDTPPDKADVAELLRISEMEKRIVSYLKKVEAELLRRAEAGESIPGKKLVEKLSNRMITDAERLTAWLASQGYDPTGYLKPPTLGSLEQLEQLIGKVELAKWTERKVTGRELVPVTDKRPSVTTAVDLLTENPA